MKETEEGVWIAITEAEAGNRIDLVLASRYREIGSRTYFQHLISEGCVLFKEKPVKKRASFQEGDELEIFFLLTPEIELLPQEIPLDILYEDEALLVINKPPGMVVHPAPGNWSGTFVNALLFHCKGLQLPDAGLRPGIVHRLDKETSGLLIAAKTAVAHRKLVERFAAREVRKSYLAICVGNPGKGEVRACIGRHPQLRKQMAVVEEGGRLAITNYQTLLVKGNLSLVRLELLTGRTHQARVHMRHLGTPILGDPVYGSPSANQRFAVKRQMLHAQRLEFLHPTKESLLGLEAPLPADMLELCRTLEV